MAIRKIFVISHVFLKKNYYQIVRFIISGLIATAVNFMVFNYIFLISDNLFLASSFGYSFGLLMSFIFSKIWVFKDKSQRIIRSFLIFCLIYLLGGLEMSLLTFYLAKIIDNYKFAWLVGASVGSLNNYLGLKYLLFKK
tara:strand:+ start:219 stop:635 length:417 start_codon:yes stop_codon:yes gene_type:complete